MPYINIKITDDGVTREQKAELIRRVTDAMVEVLGKPPQYTHIVIDEVPEQNWGVHGIPTDVFRAQRKAEADGE